MLILDFDGVICDALDECALVAWFGVHPMPADIDVTVILDEVPLSFREAFARARPHCRTLADFIVAHDLAAGPGNADVQGALRGIDPDRAASFTEQASAVRSRLRTEHPRWWLGLHHLYPGISALIGRHHGQVLVVTAKDEASARDVLRHHRLEAAVRRIVGDCRDKPTTIAMLLRQQSVLAERSFFIDDNLTNALRVAESGVPTGWAAWGYHTAGDRARAERLPAAHLTRIERADDVPDLKRRREPV